MKIKICGLFRPEDIDYINEARPDYAGFVFAKSRRQVSYREAERLREKLAAGIIPVGVFVNTAAEDIAALYSNGVIEIAQLHGSEDGEYITKLKDLCGIPVIKTITVGEPYMPNNISPIPADYYLFDSGAGSGKPFNWDTFDPEKIEKPWFLAGGINPDNIVQAMKLNPYAVDISSGAETEGTKDLNKILQLTRGVKREWKAI
ncbi:MAG: phosphoribosylanthranilate isomerase [Treponema sp.]|nr:phosphoribosylanthranilate isomerase [Treponema sp.]